MFPARGGTGAVATDNIYVAAAADHHALMICPHVFPTNRYVISMQISFIATSNELSVT
jgi:hypothetical protein